MERDERRERCARCGAVLDAEIEGSDRCPNCGALVAAPASAPPFLPDAHGVPVARFASAPGGPPVAPEPYLPLDPDADELAPRIVERPRPVPRLRIMLPQTPRRRSVWLPVGLTVLLVALMLAGIGAGVLARAGGISVPFGLPPFGQAQPTEPPPTATPACASQPTDPGAATALTQATLTTGLRNPATQDFRPVDSVTTFAAGQRAYITFEIATAQAGIAGVTFCTPAGQIPGRLTIPARSNGDYAQFSLPLDATRTGPSVATLTWNGEAAASLPFTIVAPSAA